MPIPLERKLYLSLIDHEKPEVILNQLRNFRRFAPAAIIVLHISKVMEIPPGLLAEIESLGQIHVNPVRVHTTFFSLQGAHHENLRFILGLGPAENDMVGFHASNDMLVRRGVEDFARRHGAAYLQDGIYTPPPDAAIFEDREFAAVRAQARAEVLIYSQVEGSFYQVRHLERAFRLIEEAGMDLTKPRPYFAEEIILPTLIHRFLAGSGESVGLPYIFSEAAFRQKYTEIAERLFGHSLAARILRRLLYTVGPSRISARLVDGIRKGDIGWYETFRRSCGAARFCTRDAYGVKRVAREIDDPLRAYISRLE